MKNTYLHINSRDEFLRMNIQNIIFFEADGNYTNIILANQLKGVVGMNLAQMQKLLSENLKEQAGIFVRVGKKHIINYSYVYRINVLKQKLTLSDGENFCYQLDVSKQALKLLKETFLSLSGKQND
mgnify:CR=1 FL=1